VFEFEGEDGKEKKWAEKKKNRAREKKKTKFIPRKSGEDGGPNHDQSLTPFFKVNAGLPNWNLEKKNHRF
jgi:hypothetical protein